MSYATFLDINKYICVQCLDPCEHVEDVDKTEKPSKYRSNYAVFFYLSEVIVASIICFMKLSKWQASRYETMVAIQKPSDQCVCLCTIRFHTTSATRRLTWSSGAKVAVISIQIRLLVRVNNNSPGHGPDWLETDWTELRFTWGGTIWHWDLVTLLDGVTVGSNMWCGSDVTARGVPGLQFCVKRAIVAQSHTRAIKVNDCSHDASTIWIYY